MFYFGYDEVTKGFQPTTALFANENLPEHKLTLTISTAVQC
jgi:hypothetical protein